MGAEKAHTLFWTGLRRNALRSSQRSVRRKSLKSLRRNALRSSQRSVRRKASYPSQTKCSSQATVLVTNGASR